jgi:hypothetical protein
MAAFPVPSARLEPSGELVLRAAVAAYLGRYRGLTRQHSESALRVFLRWGTDQDLDPLTAEVSRLEAVRAVGLPVGLFADVAPKVLI